MGKILKKNSNQGFVLLESILAVGVLGVIFAAAITLYSDSIKGVRYTNDQLIATYLAQDAMEQVIAKRQYNYEEDELWLSGLSCSLGSLCGVDYFTDDDLSHDLPDCSSVNACLLYFDTTTGMYSHNLSGTETYFTRTVEVTEVNAGVEAEVRVEVSWTDRSNVFREYLTFSIFNDPN